MHLFTIVNYSQFRENMASHLKHIKRSKRPTLLLQNGKAAAFVLSPRQYHELATAADEGRLLRTDLTATESIDSVVRTLRSAGNTIEPS